MQTNPPPKAASRLSTVVMVIMACIAFSVCSVMIDRMSPKKPPPTATLTPTPANTATPEPPTATPTITLTPAPTATDKHTRTPVPTNPASSLEGVMAKNMCQKFVSEKLKSPASAEYGDYQNNYIPMAKAKEALDADILATIRNPDGIWRIVGTVDSQNSFGAMIRSNYTCIIDHDLKADTWHGMLVDVN